MSIGQTLGPYHLIEKIGEGGMGVVYRARDERLEREIALKVLPTAVTEDSAARARLLHEARTASQLNHPNICIIYDVGEANGQVYIAMELVKGQPLSALARSETLSAESIARYGAQIADALAHAHEHGVVHRDLKSANVVVTSDGRTKILDFGLALRRRQEIDEGTSSRLSLDAADSLAGTLQYMAPEVLHGRLADERSDIWALGVILYELLTGKLPFQGETTFALSSAILRDSPDPLPASAPASLRTVILRCLMKKPRERYQHAREARAALEAAHSRPSGIVAAAPPRRARAGRIRSLAVLPLQNLSRDPEQDYFADGMTDDLIFELAKIGALKVISRTSVMQYKGATKPLSAIARELGVDAVIEGSVLRAGNRVRITAQLIQAVTEKHLWAESYEKELSEILVLQREVAQAIASQVRVRLTPREKERLRRPRRVIAEVYELYLKGRFHWNKVSVEGIQKAIEYFEQCLAIDPQYAPAYSAVADCYNALQFLGFPPVEVAPKASKAALRALELDPTLAAAHCSLATVKFFYDWDWAGAEEEFRRAIELDPGSAAVHQDYAYLMTALGRHTDAIAEIKCAHDLDPLSLITNVNVGWRYYFARQYDEAVRQLQKTLELDPSLANAYWCLGNSYVQLGRHQEGIAQLQRAVDLYSGSPQPRGSLGHAYGRAGRTQEARQVLADLEDLSRKIYVSPWAVAIVHIGLGDADRACAWLERAYQERNSPLVWLQVNPEFDPIRADPRFDNLLRRMRFPQ